MTSNDIAQMVRSEPYHTNLNRNVIADFIDQQADKIAELEKKLDTRTKELIGASFYEHDYKTLMAKPQLTDKDLDKLIKDAEQGGYMEMYIVGLIDGFNRARAILRKAQEK